MGVLLAYAGGFGVGFFTFILAYGVGSWRAGRRCWGAGYYRSRDDRLDRRRRGGLGLRHLRRRDRRRRSAGAPRAYVQVLGLADRRVLRATARRRERATIPLAAAAASSAPFVVGGLVGAAAAVVAPRLRRGRGASPRQRGPWPGLEAFEGAPCWHRDAAPPPAGGGG